MDVAKAYKMVAKDLNQAFEESKKHPKDSKAYDTAVKHFEQVCKTLQPEKDRETKTSLYESLVEQSQKMLKASTEIPEESHLHLLEALRKMYETAGSLLGVNASRDILGIYEALGEVYENVGNLSLAASMFESAALLHKKNHDTLLLIMKGVDNKEPLKIMAQEYLFNAKNFEERAKKLREEAKKKKA